MDELIKILNPESNYVFYDDSHGFCINTQDVLDHLCAMPSAQLEQDLTNGCTDTISREAALDAVDDIHQEHLYKQIGDKDTYTPYNEGWSDACNRIDAALLALPSAQPGWIPVTDRLPDKSGLYLVTAHNTAYGVEVYSRYWNLHPDGSFWSGWHGYEVLAWQPLPKPWEGGQNNGKN